MGRNSNAPHNVPGLVLNDPPAQHHHTATLDPMSGYPERATKYGTGHFSTFPGLLKIVQLVRIQF
jgi:hypothetical protein